MRKLLSVILMLAGSAAALQACPVSVRAAVVDRAGVVRGLQAGDFVVKVGGREIPVASANVQPPSRMFLVLDASGSMVDTPQAPNPNWRVVLAEAAEIVSRAPQGTSIGFLSFGGKLERLLEPTMDRNAVVQQIAREQVSMRYPPGKTSLWDALSHAATLLRRGDLIVVLTDGADNGSHEHDSDLKGSLAQRGITVFPVMVTNNRPLTEEELSAPSELTSLAKNTGGQLLRMEQLKEFLGHSNDVHSALQSFADELWSLADSYVLQVASPTAQKPQKLKISVRGRKGIQVLHASVLAGCNSDAASAAASL